MTDTATATETTTTETADKTVSVASTDKPADTTTDVAVEAWKPPETKEVFDKTISDAVAAETAKYQPPKDGYVDLKLPDNISVDPALPERTAAIARELGLSQDNAQKALGFVAQEVAAQTAAQVEALVKAHEPGGAQWKATEEKWRADSLADPILGGGNPVAFDVNRKLAEKVAARYGTEGFVKLLAEDPMGSHPEVMKFLVAIGKASKESDLIKGDPSPTTPKSDAEVFYPKGAGRTSAEIKAETAA